MFDEMGRWGCGLASVLFGVWVRFSGWWGGMGLVWLVADRDAPPPSDNDAVATPAWAAEHHPSYVGEVLGQQLHLGVECRTNYE